MTVESISRLERDRVVVWYTPSNRFLMSYQEKREGWLKFGRMRVALDMLVGMIGATTNFDTAGNEEFCVLVTDGLRLVSSSDFQARTRLDIPTLMSRKDVTPGSSCRFMNLAYIFASVPHIRQLCALLYG